MSVSIALSISTYLLISALSISLLVFINAQQPFVLSLVYGLSSSESAQVSGTLVFADELLALVGVLVWGSLSDKYGNRVVAVHGFIITGFALILFIHSKNVFPQMLLSRLLFSVGASSLTTLLSSILSSISLASKQQQDQNTQSQESRPLLEDNDEDISDQEEQGRDGEIGINDAKTSRLAGLIGLSSGLGALLAVFGFLRLPPFIARHFYPEQLVLSISNNDNNNNNQSLQHGVIDTFHIVAVIAFLMAAVSFIGLRLPRQQEEENTGISMSIPQRVFASFKRLVRGFVLLRYSALAGVSYLVAFSARAQTVASSLFIPILVNKYFMDTGKCKIDSPSIPSKDGCYEAFVRASIMTGVLQLVTLITAPIIGYIASLDLFSKEKTLSRTTRRNNKNPKWVCTIIGFCSIIGAMGAFGFVFVAPNDPYRNSVIIPSVIAMGISQSACIVLSLSLCTAASSRLNGGVNSKASSGAIAGAYSASGGLGIIFLSKLGGTLVKHDGGSPFIIIACLDCIIMLVTFSCCYFVSTTSM